MKKILMILLLILVACAVQVPKLAPGEIPCTLDARICPDGSAVSRNGTNNCEFDKCPVVNKKQCPLDTKECANGIVVSRNFEKNCEFDACPFQVDRDFAASYKDGKVSYVAKVEKPTPCHKYNVTQLINTTTVVNVRVNLETIRPPPDTLCAQVETVEIIQGYVLSETKPDSLTVYLDGIQLYSTKEFE